jgi:hypothetical protein
MSPDDPVFPEPEPDEECLICDGLGEVFIEGKGVTTCPSCGGDGFAPGFIEESDDDETEFDADAEWDDSDDEFPTFSTRRKS